MLKRLWEWLDVLDRLGFLWSLLVAAKTKVAVMTVVFGSASWLDGMLVGLLAGGLAWVILNINSLRHVFLKARFRSSKPPSRPTVTPTETAQVPTGEEVAESLAFLQALRALSEKLAAVTQSTYLHSPASLLQDLTHQEQAQQYLRDDNLISQAARLLSVDLQQHGTAAYNFNDNATTLAATGLSADTVRTSCNRVRELVMEYRQLVREVATFLDGLRTRGLAAFWVTDPWAERIHNNLADDYDRVMALVSNLRIHVPHGHANLLPNDTQLGTLRGQALFPRA